MQSMTYRQTKLVGIILMGLFHLCLHTSFATDRYVPGQYSTIQDAIDVCMPGDVVILDTITYTGDGNRDLNFLGKSITVRSIDPTDPNIVAATIIDCQGSDQDFHYGFNFSNGEYIYAVLDGVTITNGYTNDKGAGIRCFNSNPTIRNCVIVNNISVLENSEGGGIYCNSSNPNIINCTINNNSTDFVGAGIYCLFSNPLISNCTIADNTSNINGAGIYCSSSNPVISNCIISGNVCNTGSGGGIFCDNNSSPLIKNCAIHNNAVLSLGRVGGGVYCLPNTSNPIIMNCTITGNWASFGGGVYLGNNQTQLINCTITGNLANFGAGIYCTSDTPTIKNCILWGDWPNEIGVVTDPPAVSFSNVEGGFVGDGNIDVDPKYADPGYWNSENWIEGDYHLMSQGGRWTHTGWINDPFSSPCINMGDPNDNILDEPAPHGDRINMGAFSQTEQASKTPGFAPPTVQNLTIQGGHHKITLNWEEPTPPTAISAYKIYRGPGIDQLDYYGESIAANLSFTDTDILNNTDYFYAVSAVSDFGEGPLSLPVNYYSNWNNSDINNDGTVDLIDFALFCTEWLWRADWYQN
ncbi:MAG: hypothetical protein GY869_31230 [Planctomycetes bacterium]|nr:hypothetical protein [Planctomycetota bacterium]